MEPFARLLGISAVGVESGLHENKLTFVVTMVLCKQNMFFCSYMTACGEIVQNN